jgi:hypothetical protein
MSTPDWIMFVRAFDADDCRQAARQQVDFDDDYAKGIFNGTSENGFSRRNN